MSVKNVLGSTGMSRNPPKLDTSAVPVVETNVSAKYPLVG
jgi:hypothetical protein